VSKKKYRPCYQPESLKSQDKNGHNRRFKTAASMMAYINKPVKKK
jgi:hypothetical protein